MLVAVYQKYFCLLWLLLFNFSFDTFPFDKFSFQGIPSQTYDSSFHLSKFQVNRPTNSPNLLAFIMWFIVGRLQNIFHVLAGEFQWLGTAVAVEAVMGWVMAAEVTRTAGDTGRLCMTAAAIRMSVWTSVDVAYSRTERAFRVRRLNHVWWRSKARSTQNRLPKIILQCAFVLGLLGLWVNLFIGVYSRGRQRETASSKRTPNTRSESAPTSGSADPVTLVVDNTRFVVDPTLLAAQPNTMLGRCVDSINQTEIIFIQKLSFIGCSALELSTPVRMTAANSKWPKGFPQRFSERYWITTRGAW